MLETIERALRRFLTPALLALLTVCGPAAAAVNGLWTATSGDHLLFLQDDTNGTTFSLQVPAALNGLQVWMGSGSSASVSLQGLLNPDDRLSATISGSTMTGSLTRSGQQSALNASLSLAWVANGNAGVWQKDSSANAYLVFCVLETANGRIGLQIDVTLDAATKTYAYDIYTGILNGSNFNGASLTGSGYTSRLEFGSGKLSGSKATVTRPVQTTTYTATQIVKIGS